MDKQALKDRLLRLGMYRPARYLFDRLAARGRLDALRQDMALYGQFVRPGDLCFDVGANVGRKSEALLRLGARVVAVEPQPGCGRELMALFGDEPRFRLVANAVGSAPGTATMTIPTARYVASLRADWHPGGSPIEVELTTLDRLIAEHGAPAFCKIDVEGYESEVLAGLSRPIPHVSFEYHKAELDRALHCLDTLERLGATRVNMTIMEEHRLFYGEWLGLDDFRRRFAGDLPAGDDCWGGDIFVRSAGVA